MHTFEDILTELTETINRGFNLSKGARLHDDEFDDDDTSAEQIAETQLKYRLSRIVDAIVSEDVAAEDVEFFKEHHLEFEDKPFYTVNSNDDLRRLIQCVAMPFILGIGCNLNWIDVKGIRDMSHLFENIFFCGDISKWDTSGVEDMSGMFKHSNFNGDISNWDVSNVKNMSLMFYSSDFDGDISNWDVSSVKSMLAMFQESKFNKDISTWDVSSVQSMHGMFGFSKFNKDLSTWDVSNVREMRFMFYQAAFNSDISNWNINSKTNTYDMFKNCRIKEEFKPKALQTLSEAASNFNLRKGATLHDDEFDNDNDMNVEQHKLYIMQRCVHNLIEDSLSPADADKFAKYLKYFPGVRFYKAVSREDLYKLIRLCIKHLGTECNLNWIDVSSITDMHDLFRSTNFNGDVSEWDVSHVENMYYMFGQIKEGRLLQGNMGYCLFNGDLSKWDVSSVTNMVGMFSHCNFNGDISGWDVSGVEDMGEMFSYSKFNGDISDWDVSSVQSMTNMFMGSKFNGDISRWDVSGVKFMNNMFNGSKFTGDISDWDVSGVRDMSYMFQNSIFNGDLSRWDVSSVEKMEWIFNDAKFDGDISSWNLRSAKNWSYIFTGSSIKPKCKPKKPQKKLIEAFSSFNLRKGGRVNNDEFDNDDTSSEQITAAQIKYLVKKIKKILENRVLYDNEIQQFWSLVDIIRDKKYFVGNREDLKDLVDVCVKIDSQCDLNWIDIRYLTDISEIFVNSIFNGDISEWDVSNVEDMHDAFSGSKFNGDISKWDVSSVRDMSSMFYRSDFNGDISKWDVSNVTNMGWMFAYSSFNGDISDWDVSSVKDMKHVFSFSKFNRDISRWDVSNVTDMDYMFHMAKSFDQDLSNWDVSNVTTMKGMLCHANLKCSISNWDVSNVENMSELFMNSSNFNSDISKWDVSNVKDMSSMFKNCSNFNGDISNWDVSNVTDMQEMFFGATFNGDISNWDVSNVTNMYWMFAWSKFTGDLSKWDVSNVTNMEAMFFNAKFNGDINSWNVENVTNFKDIFLGSPFNGDISNWNVKRKAYAQQISHHHDLISPEHLPKALFRSRNTSSSYIMSEAASNFNLRKGGRLHDDDFDNDEVSADQIADTQIKYRLRKIVDRILSETSDKDEINFFKANIKQFEDDPFYAVNSKDDLENLIKYVTSPSILGNECNLNWIDVRGVTNMEEMFKLSKFNGDISKWDVGNVRNMEGMFNTSRFNGDISDWNVSNVTNMRMMFYASQFNGDISGWDIRRVENMYSMFEYSEFNRDISSWIIGENTITIYNTDNCPIAEEFKPRQRPKRRLTEAVINNQNNKPDQILTFKNKTIKSILADTSISFPLSNNDLFKCLTLQMFDDISADPSTGGIFLTKMAVYGDIKHKDNSIVGSISHNTLQYTGIIIEEAICKLLEVARKELIKIDSQFSEFEVEQSQDNSPSIDCFFMKNGQPFYSIQIKAIQSKNTKNAANSPFVVDSDTNTTNIDAGIVIFYNKIHSTSNRCLKLNGLRLVFKEEIIEKNGFKSTKQIKDKICLDGLTIQQIEDFKLGESLYADIYKILCDAVNEGEIGCDGPCGPGYNTLTNTMGVGDIVPVGMNSFGSGDKFDLIFKEPKKKKKKKKKNKLFGIATKQMLPQQK